jgi:hypothetical protein
MPPDDSYAQGVREIEALRARLARLEADARMPRAGLGDAIADAMSPTQPKPDPARRKLENAAKFYSPTEEAGFRQRAKDPERYDRELAAMGGDLLSQSIALAGREAHIKLGRDLPTPDEGDAS